MTPKIKATIVILIVFVLGITIGALSHRALVNGRMKEAASLLHGRGIVDLVEKRIGLTDEQIEKVGPVRNKYTQTFRNLHLSFRRDLSETLDSLRDDFLPYLTEDQKNKLYAKGRGGRFVAEETHKIIGKRRPQSREFFIKRQLEIIAPSDKQRDTVMAIIKKYLTPGKRNEGIDKEKMREQLSNVYRELEPILTEEQWDRLLQMKGRFIRDTVSNKRP